MIITGPFSVEARAREVVAFPDAQAYVSPRDGMIYVVQDYTQEELRDHVLMVTEPFRSSSENLGR